MSKFIVIALLFSYASFAQFVEQSFRTSMPFWSNGIECGEIDVVITGEKLEQVEKNSFINALSKCARNDKFKQVYEAESWLLPMHSPFPLKYDPVNLRIVGNIPLDETKAHEFVFANSMRERFGSEALPPAFFGGVLNYRVENTWAAKQIGGDNFSTYFDTFFNLNGFVLESQFNYLNGDTSGTGWFRGDTRIVKDFQDKEVRVQAGDVYPSSYGFMQGQPIGGVLVSTDFTLNPYSLPFPQGQGSFVLRTRSNVRTWVNGVLVKDEVLPAGSYDLRDIPLINGLNNVIVETTDDIGEKRVYQFNLPTSVELLNPGTWKFSLSSGVPFQDQIFKRKYNEDTGLLTSGFAQYGISRRFTLGGYSQQQESFTLFGTEAGVATNFGNFFLGFARSQDQNLSGQGAQASWQLQKVGSGLFNAYTLILRHQLFGQGFITRDNGFSNALKSRSQVSVTLPVKERLTVSLGAQYGSVRNPTDSDRYGFDSTLNIRVMNNLNLSMFASRLRDERRQWNDVAYAFLTWTFDGSGHLVNAFHDVENQTTRVTAVKDNANKLYSPRINSNIEKGQNKNSAEVDAFVPMPFAEAGVRSSIQDFERPDSTFAKTSVRYASAITFAYDRDNWGAGLSRPVPSSFVLFEPSDVLRKQKISLRSTSPHTESASGPFGEVTYTNLLPYQYREIQLDPTALEEGTTLEQERFVVYPTYRSAHLIPLEDKGRIILQGKLIDKNKKPIALKVGNLNSILFFTSREGDFFIEGITPGKQVLQLQGQEKTLEISIEENARGIKNLGTLSFPYETRR